MTRAAKTGAPRPLQRVGGPARPPRPRDASSAPRARLGREQTRAGTADLAVTDGPKGAVNLGWLGDTIGYKLRSAQDTSFGAFSQLAGDAGLRPGRYAVLQLIADNPGVKQTDLSRAMGRDKSTLTPMLSDLERGQFIVRKTDPLDRRGRLLSLTARGEAKLAALAACAVQHEERLNALFDPQQRKQLLALLDHLISAMDEGGQTQPDGGDT